MTADGRRLPASTLGWRLSRHARAARDARGFATEEILLACVDPEVDHTAYDYGPGRQVRKRGRVAVVVHVDSRTVITVLLRSARPWTDADARASRPDGPAVAAAGPSGAVPTGEAGPSPGAPRSGARSATRLALTRVTSRGAGGGTPSSTSGSTSPSTCEGTAGAAPGWPARCSGPARLAGSPR